MIVIPKIAIKHGGEKYEADTAYDLPVDVAEYFVRNGWAADPEGRVQPSPDLPTEYTVDPDNGLIGF